MMEQKRLTPFSILGVLEKGVCIAAIVSLVLIAAAEAIARLFHSSVPASNGLMMHILLLLGLFSGMYTAGTGDHLSIVLIHFIKSEKLRQIIAVVTGFLAVFICTVIAWSSISFIKIAIKPELIGFIPNLVFILAMPLAYCVMSLRFALRVPGKGKIFSLAALVAATAAAFPAIAKIVWGFDTPDSVFDLTMFFSDIIFNFRLPLILLLIAAALMGAPLFTVIAGIALVSIQSAGGEAEAVNNSIYSALTDSNMIAIPLFTLTGFILSESRAGERLVYSFRSLFSWIPGGMIIATVIICAFFTSFTGASGITILALGGILFTILSEKSAYPERFSIGLLTSAGCIGLLFPPSLPIILAGATSRTNIIHMFLGAIIPGLILVIAMIVMGIVASVKVKIPVEPFRLGKAASSLKESALEIILPIFLIIGYFSGVFSLVEIGAISAIYVFIAEVLIHKDIAFRDLPKVFYKALPIIGGILSIIAMAKALSYAIVDTQAPDNFAHWMQSAVESKVLFLLLLNLALLIVGCLMDIFSAILVVLPLVAPLGAVYGIDPVHLGVIFIINMEVGFLTPPVGINLFLASYRFGKPFTQICRCVLPFLIVQLAVVLLITYVPALSTFLPRFF
ncbi:MAG: TRAP transporter large permease subunit [Treponema sp.]|jgi:tripartite ATP-independent transporter DctM subunit|nr:TRAP transporter large permease subunit [Treponema sp.]